MTQRHKSFSAGKRSKDPVTFDIETEDTTHSFSAVPAIPGARLLDFIADADSDDGGKAAGAIIEFITDCVTDEDRERFSTVIRDPEISIEIETLAAIVEFLVGEYTTRPTTGSVPSVPGPSESGTGSTVLASATG